MPSSGSTRNPPTRPAIRLLLQVVGDDHPKACTGRRLIHRGLASEWRRGWAGQPAPVLLDPYAKVPLSPQDRASAESGGLLVVDCSWNKLAERGSFPMVGTAAPRRAVRRRLPLLIAGNPQHYGRLAELNTVEAFGAGLWVVGRPSEAQVLLESFHGGKAFLELNAARLAGYAGADGPAAVEAAEVLLFGGGPPGPGSPTSPK